MYTTTSKQQEGCTFKDSHPKCFITTNFEKFHREAFARGGKSRDVLTACFRDIQSQRSIRKEFVIITPPARRAWRSYKFAPFLFFFPVSKVGAPIDILGPRLPTHTWRGRHMHRDYKRIEAASRYKFSQARGSN